MRLSNSPDSLLKLRLSREFLNRSMVVSTEAQYVSTLDTLTEAKGGDYFLLHLTACARDLFMKGLDVSVSVKNLLNRQYGQSGGAEHIQTSHPVSLIPQDGRTATFKLEYRY
jgi:outer membrane receptor protein involved in Fe transport